MNLFLETNFDRRINNNISAKAATMEALRNNPVVI